MVGKNVKFSRFCRLSLAQNPPDLPPDHEGENQDEGQQDSH
jgi:hypothetical protein